MAEAARYNVDHGAQIIDINMGCPAKKVCNAWAGSALMRDEALVARILDAVVNAVDVPVTLKIRTGWAADQRNALTIARIARSAGIAALAVHGRTRDQQYTGVAEYDTIAEDQVALSIPVVANGDIDSPQKAAFVLTHTGCRRGDGRSRRAGAPMDLPRDRAPSVDRRIAAGTLIARSARHPASATSNTCTRSMAKASGVRIARKHLGWYAKDRPENAAFRAVVNRAETAEAQLQLTSRLLRCARCRRCAGTQRSGLSKHLLAVIRRFHSLRFRHWRRTSAN